MLHRFSASDPYRVLLDAPDHADVGVNRAVAVVAWLQIFLYPLIKQAAQREVFRLGEKLRPLVFFHRFAEHGFRFTLALRAGELMLGAIAAFIFNVKAIVPLLPLFLTEFFAIASSFPCGKQNCCDVLPSL